MIKYLELTAPEKSEFRQAKILSIEVSEGDHVEVGDTLFKVKSGSSEIDLPSTMKGNITEVIASVGESISVMTSLVLLETEVAESTATEPLVPEDATPSEPKAVEVSEAPEAAEKAVTTQTKAKKSRKRSAKNKAAAKAHQQQNLNLGDETLDAEQAPDPSSEDPSENNPSHGSSAASKAAAPNPTTAAANPANKSSSMNTTDVNVPDIGTDSAKVIEVLVKVGDQIAAEDPIVTLESDKASMDVPSPVAGTVSSIEVSVDQDVSEGALLLKLESGETASSDTSDEPASEEAEVAPAKDQSPAVKAESQEVSVAIPDIGGDSAKVIEILVAAGDQVSLEDPLVTLESDKASMDVPNTVVGTVVSVEVELEQDVTEGVVVAKILADSETAAASEPAPAATAAIEPESKPSAETAPTPQPKTEAPVVGDPGKSHASPSIRRFARELGVQLSKVAGSGRKGRITKDDVKGFVKGVMAKGTASAPAAGSGIPAIPEIDFSKFGEIEVQPLNKIKRLTAKNLHRSWLNVPHVTHNDEADLSDLEAFRKQVNEENKNVEGSVKLSPLAFIVKAAVRALQQYPQFNSSLDSAGENLIFKKYIHIGIAVETPNGLVVPVIRDADKMSVSKIAETMGSLAAKARDKKLSPADMSGASFTISSLGGIGGTSFTPIVNAPEVAILGVSRTKIQPVWNGEAFMPVPMLPLSLSYDHRVIDGAEAARFARHLASVLEDVRRLTV